MLFNKSLMLAVLAAATGIKAQYGVRIFADNGMSYTADDSGTVVESGKFGLALWGGDPTKDRVPITVSNGAHCHLEGTWPGTEFTDFHLKGGDSYLTPCGPNNGVTMICTGPEATCQG